MVFIFLSALAIGFSGAMMPGSLLTYTIKQSLSIGRRAGFIITTGHALLELVLIILIFLGFDKLLQSNAAQIAIGFMGGSLLICMGIDMILHAAKNKLAVDMGQKKTTAGNMVLAGIVISATNPYFLLWWAVVGLGFIMQSYHSMGYLGVILYFFGHILADFIWYGAVSIIVGTTRKFIKETPYRIVIAVLGAVLIFFGGRFLYGAITSLI